jgi:hypothetical protein
VIKQYVNVGVGANERREIPLERSGRVMTFTATIAPKRAGVRVHFELRSGDENVAGEKDVAPGLHEANFEAAQTHHLKGRRDGLPGHSLRWALTDERGQATVPLVLSEFGGDEFWIEASLRTRSGKKKKVLATAHYITWRRIYYQVSRFDAAPKGPGRDGILPAVPTLDLSEMHSEFEARRHNIEMCDDSALPLMPRVANVLEDDADLVASAGAGYDAKREPLAMRVVLVNQIADAGWKWHPRVINVDNGAATSVSTDMLLWRDESLPLNVDWLV